MKPWEKPSFEELTMNAEIGAYQADDGGESNDVPFVSCDTSFGGDGEYQKKVNVETSAR